MGSVHTRPYQALLLKLRECREKLGLTQADVAQRLGRPQSFVSKCESGERRIDVIELRDLLLVYRTDISTFMKGIPWQRGQKRPR